MLPIEIMVPGVVALVLPVVLAIAACAFAGVVTWVLIRLGIYLKYATKEMAGRSSSALSQESDR